MDRSTGIIVIVVTLLGLYLYYTGALKLPSLKTTAGPAGVGAGTLPPSTDLPPLLPGASGLPAPGGTPPIAGSNFASSLNNLDLAALLSPTATQAQPQAGTTINIFNGGQTSPSSTQGIGIPSALAANASSGTPGIGGGTFPTLPGSNNPSAVQQRVGFAQAAAGPGGALTGSLGSLVQCHGVGNCIGKGALAAGVGALTLLTLGLL